MAATPDTTIPYKLSDIKAAFGEKHAFTLLISRGVDKHLKKFINDIRHAVCVELDSTYAFLQYHLIEHKSRPRDAVAISKRLNSLHRLGRASSPPCIPGTGMLHQALRQWVRGDPLAKVARTLDRHVTAHTDTVVSHLFSLGRTGKEDTSQLTSLNAVLRMANAVYNMSSVEARDGRDKQVREARAAIESMM